MLFFRILLMAFIIRGFVVPVKAQAVGKIIINKGRNVTNIKTVQLFVLANGAKDMTISNNGSFAGRQWEPYRQSVKGWKLTSGDGVKTIYVKFRYTGGEISEIASANIELDTNPPTDLEFTINGGKEYTNNRSRLVLLQFRGEDIHKMRISPNPKFYQSPWTTFSKARKWRLTAAEGRKKLYVQFIDRAGNMSPVLESQIYLDYTPPTQCKVSVNKGARYTTKRQVNLTLSAKDASEVIAKGWKEWQPYKTNATHTLTGAEGLKRVYLKFRDQIGNVSSVVHDDIILDTKPPQDIILELNNGSTYVNDYRKGKIRIITKEASHMMIANDAGFSETNWQPYKPLLPEWSFSRGDGKKQIFVKLKDLAGNVSETLSAEIILDTKPPQNPSVKIISDHLVFDESSQITYLSHDIELVDLKIEGTGARYMMISNTSSFFGAAWQIYQPLYKNWALEINNDGLKKVFVKLRDAAGNVSKVVTDQAFVDNEAPVGGKITINNQAEYSTDLEGYVTLSLFARKAVEMLISNEPTFKEADWQPYKTNLRWQLEKEDGLKTVFVKYRDAAQNETAIYQDNIISDTEPPYEIEFTINKGAKITNNPDRAVLIRIRAKEARVMRISNTPKFENSRWRGYSELNFNWQLPNRDGDHTVYVQFRDEAGNVTEPVSDNIILDRTPPVYPAIVIEQGRQITNAKGKQVTLTLKSEEAVEMQISNVYIFKNSNWIPFEQEYKWSLPGGDGLKTVYAKFKDRVGNVSRVVYDRIGVDRQAPVNGRISINHRAKYVTDINKSVNLDLYVRSANEMLISNNESFENAEWQKYTKFVYDWILDGDDGVKTVYVCFRDEAQNTSDPVSAKIILDRQEPINTNLKIDNGAKYLNRVSRSVNLDIVAEGATEMLISNSPYFRSARWEPYQRSKSWFIFAGDGTKTVYMKFRDEAGNESSIVKDDIILDLTPPKPLRLLINDGGRLTNNPVVRLTISAQEAHYMRISSSPNFSNVEWEEYAQEKRWRLQNKDGLQRVFISFKDKAGNISQYIQRQVILSTSE